MKKMLTLFEQNEQREVINQLRESNQFLLTGDFTASIKRDGTSVFVKNGQLYKRYDANEKKGRKIPENAIVCQSEPAPNGSFPVWIPVIESDKFHLEAFNKQDSWDDGTYELVGPKVNGNKDGYSEHLLIKHGYEIVDLESVDYEYLKQWIESHQLEGLVFKCNKTGLMTKLRRKDFKFKW